MAQQHYATVGTEVTPLKIGFNDPASKTPKLNLICGTIWHRRNCHKKCLQTIFYAGSTLPPIFFYEISGLAGCSNNLYIAHETVVGLDASINSEQVAGHLMLGYDRDFATVIPKSVPVDSAEDSVKVAASGQGIAADGDPISDNEEQQSPEDPIEAREVMSVYSCSKLIVTGILLTEFKEKLYTGKAAENQAKELGSLESCDQDGSYGNYQANEGVEL